MISSERLGERLAQARERLGKSQQDVAESLGIARTTLVAMEKGEQRPSNAELLKLAQALSLSVNELLREHTVFTKTSPGRRLPAHDERLVLEAYSQELLSEGELAHYMGCDRIEARELCISRRVQTAEGGELAVELGEDVSGE